MFCPKCGTKNEDSVARCGQCGFELKAQANKGKFKGTVMMQGGPGQPGSASPGAGGAKPKVSSKLKGTMVGVAPPGADEMAKAKSGRGASNPKLKGTMVGVAPPNLDALKQQAAQAEKPENQAPAAQPSEAAARPNSKLKGTMIGLAPPNMQAEIEAARAQAAQQQAARQQASASAPSATSGSPSPAAPGPTEDASANPASKLKGTMIGVAPPNMRAEIEAAKAKYLSEKQGQPAAPAAPPEADAPPSAPVNPLGGTMVGTSPFSQGDTPSPAASGLPAGGASPTATTSPEDFSENTPAASFEEQDAARISSLPGEPTGQAPAPPPVGAGFDGPPSSIAGVPGKSSSTGPLVLLIVLLLIAAAAVAGLLLMKGDPEEGATEGETDASSEAAESE